MKLNFSESARRIPVPAHSHRYYLKTSYHLKLNDPAVERAMCNSPTPFSRADIGTDYCQYLLSVLEGKKVFVD